MAMEALPRVGIAPAPTSKEFVPGFCPPLRSTVAVPPAMVVVQDWGAGPSGFSAGVLISASRWEMVPSGLRSAA